MQFQRSLKLLAVVAGIVLCGADETLHASMVIDVTPQMVAIQKVNLLGVSATLTAPGSVHFTFDVDDDMNSVPNGSSTMDSVFNGFLPSEFAMLGVAGATFKLFSIDPEIVTVTGNGTHVKVLTKFGLEVFGPVDLMGTIGILASFYTNENSTFESDVVSLTDFGGAVFQSPDRPNDITEIFIGDNLLGLTPGTLVGVSFDRTVAPVPSSLFLFASFSVAVCVAGFRTKRRSLPSSAAPGRA